MKDKDKELLDRINDSINKEYGLDPRTPISDTQRSLREMVEQSINQYFENLGGHETIDLYDLVLKEVELPLLIAVLKQTKNNQSKASKILGLNRGNLRKKLKQYNLIKKNMKQTLLTLCLILFALPIYVTDEVHILHFPDSLP